MVAVSEGLWRTDGEWTVLDATVDLDAECVSSFESVREAPRCRALVTVSVGDPTNVLVGDGRKLRESDRARCDALGDNPTVRRVRDFVFAVHEEVLELVGAAVRVGVGGGVIVFVIDVEIERLFPPWLNDTVADGLELVCSRVGERSEGDHEVLTADESLSETLPLLAVMLADGELRHDRDGEALNVTSELIVTSDCDGVDVCAFVGLILSVLDLASHDGEADSVRRRVREAPLSCDSESEWVLVPTLCEVSVEHDEDDDKEIDKLCERRLPSSRADTYVVVWDRSRVGIEADTVASRVFENDWDALLLTTGLVRVCEGVTESAEAL
jgi:hypothetical protein